MKKIFLRITNRPVLIFLACILATTGSGCVSFKHEGRNTCTLREKIVEIAVQYEGTPYKYGGNGPNDFDCSGFTSYVFRQAKIDLPRTSNAQFSSGEKISRSELQKGDLVFFNKSGLIGKWFAPGHVGIYIGRDRFIHAPSTGGRVQTDSLQNAYWERRYKGARDLTKR